MSGFQFILEVAINEEVVIYSVHFLHQSSFIRLPHLSLTLLRLESTVARMPPPQVNSHVSEAMFTVSPNLG
jgi:hypothetical protein